MNKPILDVLAGRNLAVPPLWMMRQAGRYLPEYRALRAMAGSFLDLALTPDFATEVTLQPIRRFGFDAAILFSDILIVPMAMGRSLRFVEGEGPRLDPLDISDGYIAGNVDSAVFAPVYETVRRVKAALPDPVALLGFCGAPWTVATYVIAGRGTPDQGPARMAAYRHPEAFEALIRAIEAVSIDYLVGQLQAGADAVQIFDSWAGILPPAEFARWAIDPARRICDGVRARVPGARFIGFPRAAGTQLGAYCRYVPVQAVGLDWTENAEFVRQAVPAGMAVQGNLDPLALMAGGAALDRAVDAILNDYRERPFIFNLGHGILPETPIAHVETMIRRVRGA